MCDYDIFYTLAGKYITVFGCVFKKDTGNTGETAAAYVSKYLREGVHRTIRSEVV